MEIQKTNFGSISVIRCGFHEGKYDYMAHLHQFCELIWVLEGEIEIISDSRTEIARAGDIAVITPFLVHSFNTPAHCKIWICVFSNNFIDTVPFDYLSQRRNLTVFTPTKYLLDYLWGNDFVNKCFDFYKDPNDSAYHTLRSMFYLVVAEYFSKTTFSKNAYCLNTLSKILIYMSEHFREDLTQRTLGRALGYHPRYISNCFDAIPNMNFRAMLNSLRIEYAKHLLLTTDLSIADIAVDSGFSGERSFHRAFLSIVGMTPGQYKREKRAARG